MSGLFPAGSTRNHELITITANYMNCTITHAILRKSHSSSETNFDARQAGSSLYGRGCWLPCCHHQRTCLCRALNYRAALDSLPGLRKQFIFIGPHRPSIHCLQVPPIACRIFIDGRILVASEMHIFKAGNGLKKQSSESRALPSVFAEIVKSSMHSGLILQAEQRSPSTL